MRRSHDPNDGDAHSRLIADISNALTARSAAWVDFINECHRSDLQAGYEAFWAGPDWFVKELGQPVLNGAGRHFEALLWSADIRAGGRLIRDILPEARTSRPQEAINDLLNPVDFLYAPKFSEQLIGVDARALAHVTRLLEQSDRHFQHEIELAAKRASHTLLGRGKHTPEPHSGRFPEEARPPLVRNPAVDHFSDQMYWYSKYWYPVVFGSEHRELTSRRWYPFLIPLIAPEFVLSKALSAPGKTAYVLSSEGDWTWAIVADTAASLSPHGPELILINNDPKSRNGDIWRPPTGRWLLQGWTHYELTQSVRGMEMSLVWLVRHWRRVIRFYHPELTDLFASRGETLLPLRQAD